MVSSTSTNPPAEYAVHPAKANEEMVPNEYHVRPSYSTRPAVEDDRLGVPAVALDDPDEREVRREVARRRGGVVADEGARRDAGDERRPLRGPAVREIGPLGGGEEILLLDVDHGTDVSCDTWKWLTANG